MSNASHTPGEWYTIAGQRKRFVGVSPAGTEWWIHAESHTEEKFQTQASNLAKSQSRPGRTKIAHAIQTLRSSPEQVPHASLLRCLSAMPGNLREDIMEQIWESQEDGTETHERNCGVAADFMEGWLIAHAS